MSLRENDLNSVINRLGGDHNGMVALASEVTTNDMKWRAVDTIRQLMGHSFDHIDVFARLCQELVSHSWEVFKENNLIPAPEKATPLMEFTRHVRNGCSHGNRFNFRSGKVKRPAEWRGVKLADNHNGTRIFRDSLTENGQTKTLNVGDPLLLLSDLSKEILG